MNDINIPLGARLDPNAPFNKVDHGNCIACEGNGVDTNNDGDIVDCEFCEGSGKMSEEMAQDAYESYLEDMNER